jgi:hypothetical protein
MNIHSFILPLCLCLLITFFPTRPIHFLLCWIYSSQAVPRKSIIFCDVMSYSLVEVRLRAEILLPPIGSKSCLHLALLAYLPILKLVTLRSSQTYVIYHTTRRRIPEDRTFHSQRYEEMKSDEVI